MSKGSILNKYLKIKKMKNKFGDYKKILFHVHTPASYDYRFKSDWTPEDFKKLDENKINNEYNIDSIDEKMLEVATDKQLKNQLSIFKTNNELYSYLLIANELLKNNYEMVVVTDHNTIKGNQKLQVALNCLYDKTNNHCNVIYGIEITCADRLHVVGIFKNEQLNEITGWLDEHLISEEYGVMKSSYDVLKDLYKYNCYAYIAHINTSDLFSKKNMYSGGYKKELLGGEYSKFIGVNSKDKIAISNSNLKKIKDIERNYILDCDAHSHEELPNESMWIKVTNNTTNSLFEALEEYQITVRLDNPEIPSIFIEGIIIDYNRNGYLSGKNKNDYVVKYSPSLNSYIGGRGTGKSTTLDLINIVLTQDFKDKDQLYFFSSHGDISILINYFDKKYIVNLALPSTQSPIELIAILSDLDPLTYRTDIQYNKNKIKKTILQKHITIYEVIENEIKETEVKKQNGKKVLLKKFYDDKYSINALVEMVNSDRIGDFIYELLFDDNPVDPLQENVRFRSEKGLLKFFDSVEGLLKNRTLEIESIIAPYNMKEKDRMKIIYKQKNIEDNELPNDFVISKSIISVNYDITRTETEDYIKYLIRKYGFIGFIRICTDKSNLSEVDLISSFARNNREPNYDKEKLTHSNNAKATRLLFDEFMKDNNSQKFASYYKNKLNNLEQFSIEFNVNTYESSNNLRSIFKDIKELSLGQKVVTILNLILSHGIYSENLKPIIIDQPEDNLDSRYIYKNLVEQLRQLKEMRQIIIATHNSTIVTNSLSENVIAMDSDGEYGWVRKYGYTLDHSIKKEILNILEGGQDSFAHRQNIFTNIIK